MSILAPVTNGRTDTLRGYLSTLPAGGGSPFEALPQTHFARFLIVDAFEAVAASSHRIGPLMDHYLLFTSYYFGRPAGYREALRLRAGGVADDIWDHCIGYPGQWNRRAFHAYLRHNEVRSQHFFAAYSASVNEVRTALRLQQQYGRFVTRRSLPCDDETLRGEFLNAFAPRGEQVNR